jgi:hypothetical protein
MFIDQPLSFGVDLFPGRLVELESGRCRLPGQRSGKNDRKQSRARHP